jgi:hypothetical protein
MLCIPALLSQIHGWVVDSLSAFFDTLHVMLLTHPRGSCMECI